MHISLFGGAFDPPHIGHQEVVRYVLKEKITDEVWFVPVKQHPFGKTVEVNGHRIEMLKLILEPKMRVEMFELKNPGKSFSFDTLLSLSKTYPQHRFSWIIGTDNLSKFHLWEKYQELVEKFTVYVYPREGSEFKPLYDNMIPLKKAPLVQFSSTGIREMIKKGESITGLVDPKVAQYIKENNLYLK
jgi:nicotinate-nucleotide adenylyltransferase